MNLLSSQNRVLDPMERFAEIVFGLIMVLSFTCAFSVADPKEDVRAMLIGAIGCNLAWGIIDAVFYLIACLTEKGHGCKLLTGIQQARDSMAACQVIREALPAKIAEALEPADFEHLRIRLSQLPPPPKRPRLAPKDYLGAMGVFLLVFLSTFPVVVPYLLFENAWVALRVSNSVAIVLLFGAAHMLAVYANLPPIRTGLTMVAIGVVLVALTIALGG